MNDTQRTELAGQAFERSTPTLKLVRSDAASDSAPQHEIDVDYETRLQAAVDRWTTKYPAEAARLRLAIYGAKYSIQPPPAGGLAEQAMRYAYNYAVLKLNPKWPAPKR